MLTHENRDQAERRTGQPPGATGGRCLLVANRAMPCQGLGQLLIERCHSRPAEVHVLVSRLRNPVLVPDPVFVPSPIRQLDQQISVDDASFRVAEARLDSFVRALSGLGLGLTGEIVADSPHRGARRALRSEAFDEVVVISDGPDAADLPDGPPRSGRSRRRTRRDLAERLRRSSEVPVTSLVLHPVLDLG